MPGTIPATSQLDRLISMTAINVLAGSRAMRDRLKLFDVCMGRSIGSQRTMDAVSTPPPHRSFNAGWNGASDGAESFFIMPRVPGPTVGAGLPGLAAACIGLVALALRRRK